jgi:hypothetical protein
MKSGREAESPVMHFVRLSVTAYAQLCGGVVVPLYIGINSQLELKLSSEQNNNSPTFLNITLR